MTVPPALAGALERGRDRFNGQVANARVLGRTADAAALTRHLREVVAPIAEAVHGISSDRTDAVVAAAFDISLELMADGLLGRQARHPSIEEGWRKILPAIPWLLALQPREAFATITNALYNLSLQQGARPHEWVAEMTRLGPEAKDLDSLRMTGHVLAWRSGMPQHRRGAIESCARLAPPIALRALGISKQVDDTLVPLILDRLRNDPWLTPDEATDPGERRLRIVARVGGFRGFGGVFRNPPLVELHPEGSLLARDDQAQWLLSADVFGTSLRRTDAPRRKRKSTSTAHGQVRDDGAVEFRCAAERFDDLRGLASFAADDTTMAVTLDRSHAIYLVALQ